MPDVFFLVEEQSNRDLSKLTAPAYFFGGKLIFVGVANFGQIKKIRFVVAKIFQSYSNQFSVILIWSNKLASLFFYYYFFFFLCLSSSVLTSHLVVMH